MGSAPSSGEGRPDRVGEVGGDDQGGAARPARAEGGEGGDGGVEVGHREAVGQLAQRRGDRGAGFGLHRDQRRHRAQHAFGPDDRRRAVAAGQPDRQRLHPRPPVRPLLLGLPLLRDELGHPAARGLVRGRGVRAALLQRGVALGEGPELLAGARQVGFGDRGALLRFGERVGQPLDLLRRGRGAAAQGLGPARERREPGAAVGERADGGQVRAFGRGQRAFVLGPRLGDLRERAPRLHDRRDQRLFLLGDRVGLGVELVGVAAGSAGLGRGREVARPLLGQADGAREPLRQRGEPVPGVLRRSQPRGVLGEGGLQPLLLDAARRELASTSARRARALASSASSLASSSRSVTRSSAASRSRASRSSDCTACARRAISACRPSGLSWRRSSAVRSVSRVRLACIASSLRSAFSLRLRCLRTPAASSM